MNVWNLLKFPLGMYTLPDGVRTKHDGSKSPTKSDGLPVTRPFIRLIVGFRGGTSGGAEGGSRRQPAKWQKQMGEKPKNISYNVAIINHHRAHIIGYNSRWEPTNKSGNKIPAPKNYDHSNFLIAHKWWFVPKWWISPFFHRACERALESWAANAHIWTSNVLYCVCVMNSNEICFHLEHK